ncbi:Uncharacterised protein [uncultured archaeon]|nr:Uncharacterised protein [uncultured archaeon]
MKDYEVVAVNYWKDVKNDLRKTLSVFWTTLFLIHNSEDFKEIVNFLKNLPYGKIIYITLTKTNDSLKPYFKEINTKILVVDCVSSMLFEKGDTQGCIFEEPPANLNEMKVLIEKYLKNSNPDFIVLDSLSHFFDISSISASGGQQLSSFFGYLKDLRTPCRFVIFYDNVTLKDLRFLPFFEADLVLRLEVITGRIYWGD